MADDLAGLGRFSDVSLLILLSLAGGTKHGYAMIEDIARFSGTILEPGTLYGALLRLERRAWIEALPADDRRHPYRITPDGARALREQLATMRRIVAAGVERLALA